MINRILVPASPNIAALVRPLPSGLKLAAGLILLLAGCSQDDSTQTPPPPASTAQSAPEPVQIDDPVTAGKKTFRVCAACHTVDKDGSNLIGPNLYGIYGAKAGSRADFTYSKAFRAVDIVWNDESLDAFLTRPSKYIPNNRMSYGGIKDEQKRAHLIAYLKTLRSE